MIVFDSQATQVLSQKQQELLPLLEEFSKTHFLIWGTAISLQLGHRKSIDFDFINSTHQWSLADFKSRIELHGFSLLREEVEMFFGQEFENMDEFHFTINDVKWSCFNYYRTLYDDQKIEIYSDTKILWWLRTASLEQLLCMKLFACITRSKWKDAVDIYFILREIHMPLSKALMLCKEKYFINIFNTDAVMEQFISENWDTTESVEYLIQNPPEDIKIIKFLSEEAQKIVQI